MLAAAAAAENQECTNLSVPTDNGETIVRPPPPASGPQITAEPVVPVASSHIDASALDPERALALALSGHFDQKST